MGRRFVAMTSAKGLGLARSRAAAVWARLSRLWGGSTVENELESSLSSGARKAMGAMESRVCHHLPVWGRRFWLDAARGRDWDRLSSAFFSSDAMPSKIASHEWSSGFLSERTRP